MENRITSEPGNTPAFDVDGMLGGLVKWLRILGYDAAFPRSQPTSPHRVFVTAAAHKARGGDVVVTATHRLHQLVEVLQQTGIELDEALIFSRCVLCNEPVVPVPHEEVHGKVPEYIYRTGKDFHACPKCGRIYWEGSHLGRVKSRLHALRVVDE
jgi:uncharacterized protein